METIEAVLAVKGDDDYMLIRLRRDPAPRRGGMARFGAWAVAVTSSGGAFDYDSRGMKEPAARRCMLDMLAMADEHGYALQSAS